MELREDLLYVLHEVRRCLSVGGVFSNLILQEARIESLHLSIS